MTDPIVKMDEIEDFLNESFVVLDEIEEPPDTIVASNKNVVKSGGNESNIVIKECKVILHKAEIKVPDIDDHEEKTAVDTIKEQSDHHEDDEEDHEIFPEHNKEESGEKVQNTVKTEENQLQKVNNSEVSENDVSENVTEAACDEEKSVPDSHPYLSVVESFKFTKEQMTISDIGPPTNPAETQLCFVHTKELLLKAIQVLKKAKEIAVDVEVDNKSFEYSVILVMLSTKEIDYIIDATVLKSEMLLLTEVFINPEIVKIIYNTELLLSCLQRDFRLFLVNIFCVDKTLRVAHSDQHMGMSTVLKSNFSIENFRETKLIGTDFYQRPLTAKLKMFLRSVAHYLIYVYHFYKNDLLKNNEKMYKDLLNQFREASKTVFPDRETMLLKAGEKDLKERHDCQMDCLRKLYNWRHTIAKKLNKSPELIVPKIVLVNIAASLPSTDNMVFNISSAPYVRTDIKKILGIIEECKAVCKLHGKVRKKRNKKSFLEKQNATSQKRKLNDEIEPTPNKQKRVDDVAKNNSQNETVKPVSKNEANKKNDFSKNTRPKPSNDTRFGQPQLKTSVFPKTVNTRPSPFLQSKPSLFNVNVGNSVTPFFKPPTSNRNENSFLSSSFSSQSTSLNFEPPSPRLNRQGFNTSLPNMNREPFNTPALNLRKDSFSTSGLNRESPNTSTPSFNRESSGHGFNREVFNMPGPGLSRESFDMSGSSLNRDTFNMSGPSSNRGQSNMSGPDLNRDSFDMSRSSSYKEPFNMSGSGLNRDVLNISGPGLNRDSFNTSGQSSNREQFDMPGHGLNRESFNMSGSSENREPFDMPESNSKRRSFNMPGPGSSANKEPFNMSGPASNRESLNMGSNANRELSNLSGRGLNRDSFNTSGSGLNREAFHMSGSSANREPFMSRYSSKRDSFNMPGPGINREALNMSRSGSMRESFNMSGSGSNREPDISGPGLSRDSFNTSGSSLNREQLNMSGPGPREAFNMSGPGLNREMLNTSRPGSIRESFNMPGSSSNREPDMSGPAINRESLNRSRPGLNREAFNSSGSGLNRNSVDMLKPSFNREPFNATGFGPSRGSFNTSGYGRGRETEDDVLKRCLLAMKSFPANRSQNRNFEKDLNVIDDKINTLERRVSGFSTNSNFNNAREMYKRRF